MGGGGGGGEDVTEKEDEEKSWREGSRRILQKLLLHHSITLHLTLPPSLPLVQSPSPHQITKPHRIILVRHGESTGNVDERVYVQTPDWKVGRERGREVGIEGREEDSSFLMPQSGPYNPHIYVYENKPSM